MVKNCLYSPSNFWYSFFFASATAFTPTLPVPPLPSVSDKKFSLAFATSAYFVAASFCRFSFSVVKAALRDL